MPRIILIRPGDTEYAHRHALLGRCDPDLSESGHLAARNLADVLSRYPIQFLGVSPLKRAVATALPLEYQQDLTLHPAGAFHAADMGDWDTLSIDDIKSVDRARYEAWLKDPDFPAPGGESLREVFARVYPELVNIVEYAHPDETICLVLQQTVLRVACCAIMNLPLESARRFHMDHGAFGVFERLYPGGPYQMLAWNYNSHLTHEETPLYEMEGELPGV